eukprot:2404185-Amphidinium_carterae.1
MAKQTTPVQQSYPEGHMSNTISCSHTCKPTLQWIVIKTYALFYMAYTEPAKLEGIVFQLIRKYGAALRFKMRSPRVVQLRIVLVQCLELLKLSRASCPQLATRCKVLRTG